MSKSQIEKDYNIDAQLKIICLQKKKKMWLESIMVYQGLNASKQMFGLSHKT